MTARGETIEALAKAGPPELPGGDDARAHRRRDHRPRDPAVAALDQTGAIIAGIRDDQEHLPTPCRSWDATKVVAHLVHDLDQFTARATGGTPDWSAPMAAVDGDYIDAYRVGATALVQAWRAAGDLTGTVEMPPPRWSKPGARRET